MPLPQWASQIKTRAREGILRAPRTTSLSNIFIFGRGGSAPTFPKEENRWPKHDSLLNQNMQISKLTSILSSLESEMFLEIRGAPGGAPMKSWQRMYEFTCEMAHHTLQNVVSHYDMAHNKSPGRGPKTGWSQTGSAQSPQRSLTNLCADLYTPIKFT